MAVGDAGSGAEGERGDGPVADNSDSTTVGVDVDSSPSGTAIRYPSTALSQTNWWPTRYVLYEEGMSSRKVGVTVTVVMWRDARLENRWVPLNGDGI